MKKRAQGGVLSRKRPRGGDIIAFRCANGFGVLQHIPLFPHYGMYCRVSKTLFTEMPDWKEWKGKEWFRVFTSVFKELRDGKAWIKANAPYPDDKDAVPMLGPFDRIVEAVELQRITWPH